MHIINEHDADYYHLCMRMHICIHVLCKNEKWHLSRLDLSVSFDLKKVCFVYVCLCLFVFYVACIRYTFLDGAITSCVILSHCLWHVWICASIFSS